MSLSRRPLYRWLSDRSGTSPERWALIAGGIAVACVAGARVADTATKATVLAAYDSHRLARATSDSSLASRANSGDVDHTATASIAASTARLDPCTGQTR